MYDTQVLQVAIFARLTGNVGATVHDHVPQGTAYPYVVLGEWTEVPDDLHNLDGGDLTLTMHVWSAALGVSQVNAIMKAIDGRLHHFALSPSAGRVWSCVREMTQTMRDEDPETKQPLRHGVVRYRLGLTEAAA